MPSTRLPPTEGPHDAIVVPGSGLRPDGTVPPWVENRLERALELSGTSAPVILLSAGTVHKPPPLDASGRPVFEALAAAEWFLSHGFDACRILVETASWDTVGNAYFLRVIHTDPRGWRRLLVISSEFHLPRIKALFSWVFGLAPVAPPYQLNFEAVPDVGMTDAVRDARRMKEASSLQGIRPVIDRIRSLDGFHEWLYTAHGAYAVAVRRSERASLPGSLLDSY